MITYNVYDDVANLRDLVDAFFSESEYRHVQREYPAVNIIEKDDHVTVEALVPGVARDALSINLVDTTLIIEGEKKEDYSEERYLRKERQFGNFKRSIKLPYRVNGENISANLEKGVLTIRLAKSEDAKPKRIAIQ